MSKGLQNSGGSRLVEVLAKHEAAILDEWIKQMSGADATRRSDERCRSSSAVRAILKSLRQGAESGNRDLRNPRHGSPLVIY